MIDKADFYNMSSEEKFKFIDSYYDNNKTLVDVAEDLNMKYNTLYVYLRRLTEDARGAWGQIWDKWSIPIGEDCYIAARIRKSDREELREKCLKNNTTMQKVIHDAVINYIKDNISQVDGDNL